MRAFLQELLVHFLAAVTWYGIVGVWNLLPDVPEGWLVTLLQALL